MATFPGIRGQIYNETVASTHKNVRGVVTIANVYG
jgi:hypothetical protein